MIGWRPSTKELGTDGVGGSGTPSFYLQELKVHLYSHEVGVSFPLTDIRQFFFSVDIECSIGI